MLCLVVCVVVVVVVVVVFLFLFVFGGEVVPANPSPHANFRKTHQNRGPTASGVGNSESTQNFVQIPWVKSKKGIRKVCFTAETLLL